jgi:hypothetical protein
MYICYNYYVIQRRRIHKLVKLGLKIAKGKPEAVRRRRTTNTITKRKRTNNDTENSKIYGNNEHFKISAIKLKIE